MHLLLRARPDHRGAGRRAQLERTVLRVHALLLLLFSTITLVPLARGEDVTSAEAITRTIVVGLYVWVTADLLVRGERLSHLVVLGVATVAGISLGRWPYAGDSSSDLALSALTISAARLLVLPALAVVLVVLAVVHTAARATVDDVVPLVVLVDGSLLTAVLTLSVAFFIGSLEDRTAMAERLDAEALAREAELARVQGRQLAVAAAGQVLHDDVLSVLRLVADGDPAADERVVREASRRCVAAVREIGR